MDSGTAGGVRRSFARHDRWGSVGGMERRGGEGRARGQSHEVDRDRCRAMPITTSRARRVTSRLTGGSSGDRQGRVEVAGVPVAHRVVDHLHQMPGPGHRRDMRGRGASAGEQVPAFGDQVGLAGVLAGLDRRPAQQPGSPRSRRAQIRPARNRRQGRSSAPPSRPAATAERPPGGYSVLPFRSPPEDSCSSIHGSDPRARSRRDHRSAPAPAHTAVMSRRSAPRCG